MYIGTIKVQFIQILGDIFWHNHLELPACNLIPTYIYNYEMQIEFLLRSKNVNYNYRYELDMS